MGKKSKARSALPDEQHLLLPARPNGDDHQLPKIIDTHTHLLHTFQVYRHKYPAGKFESIFDFVHGIYQNQGIESIVDVWCDAPVIPTWRELADSAMSPDAHDQWGGIQYWFVIGVHPHHASAYNDEVEKDLLNAMEHPRNVGWGEIGLDYHYDNSPRPVQQEVFARQLRHAIRLNKPLTIHTREAEEDTERIIKEIVPRDWNIHIHCFTDTPEFAQRLLDWFPNLHIGITGVITYSTNLNTSALVRSMRSLNQTRPRLLLETDAPYMVPANIYNALPKTLKGKLPICHSAMVPYVAAFVADILTPEEAPVSTEDTTGQAEHSWTAENLLDVCNENARFMYKLPRNEA